MSTLCVRSTNFCTIRAASKFIYLFIYFSFSISQRKRDEMIIKRHDVLDATLSASLYECSNYMARDTLIAVIVCVYREGIPEQPRAKVPREEEKSDCPFEREEKQSQSATACFT